MDYLSIAESFYQEGRKCLLVDARNISKSWMLFYVSQIYHFSRLVFGKCSIDQEVKFARIRI